MCVLMILLFFLVLFVCSFFCLNGGRKDKSEGGGDSQCTLEGVARHLLFAMSGGGTERKSPSFSYLLLKVGHAICCFSL